MHEEDILLRAIRGTAYLAIAPCILLSAAGWFTSDSTGIVIANLFHVYFFLKQQMKLLQEEVFF